MKIAAWHFATYSLPEHQHARPKIGEVETRVTTCPVLNYFYNYCSHKHASPPTDTPIFKNISNQNF
jgi:hypothetical protein